MNEEQVTKRILKWLISNGWIIVCFDFPQSGTGRLLHPNGGSDKNKGCICPDIVAVRGKVCTFFENKDRFYKPDFLKVNNLIVNNEYSEAIGKLLKDYDIQSVSYGIGLPTKKFTSVASEYFRLVDFIICVEDSGAIKIGFIKFPLLFP